MSFKLLRDAAKVIQENHYYPFGQNMVGIEELDQQSLSSQEEQKFQYNAKEKLDEFGLFWNDHGARNLDLQTARWTTVDPLAEKYSNTSCYVFVLNRPINAVDPDGRVVIFINGHHGFPSVACCGASAAHWGTRWIKDVQTQIGDFKAKYYDGSIGGGAEAILFGLGDPVLGNSTSLNHATRRLAGYNTGKMEAADIVNSLEKDEYGNITESIKFITSSMGTAYQRGFSQAIADYVSEQNTAIDAYNNSLPKNKDGSVADPWLVKQRLNVNIEYTVDLDAFQGSEIGIDPNSTANYYMVNSGLGRFFVGGTIEGSTQLGIDANGNSTMHGHHPSYAPAEAIPISKQNPKNIK